MSLREQLRAATREKHAELDGRIGSLRPFESPAGYAAYLSGMRELYLAYGDALDTCAQQATIPTRGRALLGAIADDLAACGNDTDSLIDRGNAEGARSVVEPGCGAAWGAAYVLEGSTLGAQMLVRQAQQKLPSGATTHFLQALAADGMERFRQFCAALDAADADAEQVIGGATAVFEHAIAWFDAHAPAEEAHGAT